MHSRRNLLRSIGATIGVGATGCIGGSTTALLREGHVENQARNDEQEYVPVYQDVADSVTGVRTYGPDGPVGSGSGFVYDEEYVLTNHHVIEGGTEFEVRFRNNDWRRPTVVASDVLSDLAVLRVPDHPDYANPLTLRRQDPTVGEEVILVGNPFGFEESASVGIISGVDRSVSFPVGDFTIHDTIQTDAAANPGNSGGPLVTMNRNVAGILSLGPTEAINFAISASLARRVVPALVEEGDYRHPYLGIEVLTVAPIVAEANGLSEPNGVLITDVSADGPAAEILRGSDDRRIVNDVSVPAGGDIIVALENRPVETERELFTYLTLEVSPGETVGVTVTREGEERTLDVTVGARPEL